MDEKSIELRDQLALSILNGLLSNSTNDKVKYIQDYCGAKNFEEAVAINIKKLVRLSYQMADEMRKIRLSSFE